MMRQLFLILFTLILVPFHLFSQDSQNCGDFFFDPGGPGTAGNSLGSNVNHTDTLCPDPTCPDLQATVEFDFISMETGFDRVRVYDGTSFADPLLANFTGSYGPQTVSASSPGGCLLVRTTTDGSIASSGFDATFSCNDIVAPVFTTCPGNQTGATNTNCEFFIPDYTAMAVVTEGCTFTLTQVPVPGTSVTAGTHTITLTADDGTNQTDCMFDLVVSGQAGPLPNASVSSTSTCANASINFSETGTNIDTWLWDFGDGNTSTLQNPSHTYADTGSFEVSLTVSNLGNGCTQSNIVVDTIVVLPPVANFNLNPSNGCAIPHTVFFTDQSTLPNTWFWDFGDGNTSTAQNPIHTYTSTGDFTVNLTVTDTVNGCSDAITSAVSINIPTAAFGSDVTSGCRSLTVNFSDASSNTGAATITNWDWDFGDGNTSTQQNPTHTYQNNGTYTVSLTITIANGCTSTSTQPAYITVTGPNADFSADVLSGCPPLTVNFTDQSLFSAPINNWDWDFGDGNNSSLQNPSHIYTTYDTMDVSLTVTDLNGCSSTFSLNNYINTLDNIDPSITCPGNQNEPFDASCQFILPDYTGLASANDNCGTPVISQSPAIGTAITATTAVTLTATDGAGNTASCSFDVIPSDNIPPNITCPANQNINFDMNCQFTLTDYTGMASTSDNCSGTVSVSQSPAVGTILTSTTTVTLTADDGNGNTASCSFDVIPSDNIPPSVACPGNQNVNFDANCQFTLADYTGMASASDNCSGTVSISQSPAAGTILTSTTTVTLTVNDGNGNTASCSFDVIPSDNIPPSISCPGNINQNNDPGQCGAIVNYTAPVGADNCSGATSITQTAGLASGSNFPIGTTTNTFEVTDAAGNTASCSFDVMITDTENPNIVCPTDIQTCDSIIFFSDPTISDNCNGAGFMLTSGLASGSTFPIGTTTNSYTVTDASGNMNSCTVAITRFQLPTIDAGPNQSIDAGFSVQIDAISSNAQSYSWIPPGSLDDPTVEDPVANPNQTTTYTITVTSVDGCTAEDEVTITVNEEIEINNFMSPNADGKNDTWIIKGNYLLDDCKIQIMDSWGNILFESTGYDNDWNGTHNGKELPDGNYYYVISCRSEEPLTGAITLIR